MIRRVVETNTDQILEVIRLLNVHGQEIDEIDLAETIVVRGPDGQFTCGYISTLAVHAIQ